MHLAVINEEIDEILILFINVICVIDYINFCRLFIQLLKKKLAIGHL